MAESESGATGGADAPVVGLHVDGGVAIVEIDRPTSLNALSVEVLAGLIDAVRAAATDDAVRGVIVSGAGGRAFAAGADIRGMQSFSPAEARRSAGLGHELGALLESIPQPVIAAVDGVALGGGCELALACDFVYASAQSRFGQPEVKLGLIPGFGGTVRLPRAVGIARAKELIYSGRMVAADEALAIGLVNRVLPDRDALFAAARETLAEISANSGNAVALAKGVLVEASGRRTEHAVAIEIDGFEQAFGHPEHDEGFAAFLEKRAPRF
ncbi:enoyl-CoA hydratase/isomerase family protein [Agromyces seonyuensis]|uniref:enoyl-CoA hydratase n=1 Tax=Agromyces seonyuensis TaxID=2662446 RepID=A0A6I4NYY0_9MICO|nr:enoyl-CoA hydratase-related protein [Agromyces seonyuensis]MWB99553.1 enoyl-CoA hydratase [Agromyces seonyuensis]